MNKKNKDQETSTGYPYKLEIKLADSPSYDIQNAHHDSSTDVDVNIHVNDLLTKHEEAWKKLAAL